MAEWVNWAETFRGPVNRIEQPGSLEDLQKIVQSVTYAEGRVHPEGSRWAFSVPAYCEDVVVDTSLLNKFPKVLQYAIVKPEREPGRLLLAVEAGIKVHDLYRAIAFDQPRRYTGPRPDALPPELRSGRIWTLPVLGGAGGQSLAGVINTGTHGGDVARPPLSDAVRAMVIVSTGGQLVLLEPDPGQGLPIVDADQLASYLGQPVLTRRETALFDAAVVSVGRFGVVWAYVVEVHDETSIVTVETRTQTTWEAFRPNLVAEVMGAAARDEFLQLAINPYPAADLCHAAYVTRHTMVPGHPTDPSRAPNLPLVNEARRSSFSHLVFQAMGFDEPLAFVSDVIELIRSIHGLELLVIPYALERAGHISHPRPNGEIYLVGDFMADVLEFLTTLGRPDVISILTRRILDIEQRDRLIVGPLSSPWEVKGTRFEVADFYDYDGPGYRGDSVELFFPVNPADPTELPATIDALLRVFDVLRGERQPVAAYFAVRFMAATRATLGLARWSPTCSVELAMLRGLRGNARALRLLQEVCLARGGVVHWGQRHNLEPRDLEAGFGTALTRWREQLRGFHGSDVVFSTPFTRARNLEVVDPADWTGWVDLGLPGRGAVALPDGFDVLSRVEVFARDDRNVMNARRILRSGRPEGVWYPVRPEPVHGRASVFRGRSGRLELFAIDDSFLKHTYQEAPLATAWSGWDVKGYPASIRYEEAIDAADGPIVAVTAHGDGRIETFGRASRVDEYRLAHCWANARDGWGWSHVWHRGTGSLAGAPSAANRRLRDGRDHMVVVAADTDGVIKSMHQVDPANSAAWSDWRPLNRRIQSVGTRGAVVVAPAAAPVHVFTVGPGNHLYYAVDRGTGITPTFGPWRELDVEVDPQARLAVVATRSRVWVATHTLRGEVVCWDFAPGSPPISRFLGAITRKDVALGAYPGEDTVYVAVRDDTRSGRVFGRRILASS